MTIDGMYPRWRYASGKRSRIVNTPEEMAKYSPSPEWGDSPNLMDAPTEVPQQVASPVIAGLVSGADTLLKRFYTVPAKTIADQVLALADLDDVREVRDMEEMRPGGPRKGVMQAVLARMEQLSPVPDDAQVQ